MKTDVGEISLVSMKKVVLWRPFYNLWFIDNQKYWARDQDLEIRASVRSNRSLEFDGWHIEEGKPMTSCRLYALLCICMKPVVSS